MLKANVGLSRKVSRDYNSTGFSVNLEGEITAPLEDTEAVLDQLRHLWDTAEEALVQQVEQHRSIDTIASRDAEPTAAAPQNDTTSNGHNRMSNGEPATNKQIQYLLSIGKRKRLNTVQLEQLISKTLGKQTGLYDLSKREAGQMIDVLRGDDAASNGHANGRRA